MSENNKTILIKANEAVSKGDYEGFLEYCTEDTKWIFIGDQILNGKKEVRKWMLTEYIVPPRVDVTNLIAENDYVTALGQITLINEKGVSVQYCYCDVWKFRDGKMAELTAFVIEPKNWKKTNNIE
ncbi:MAG TPA: nuclear transport factor 2 family protein [Chitinophagaceae bacterium]|jgi:ketosteroid isomerase-like protein|nr:nuclear transport factor 2 family protein [Chitinophagaceae bacterium]